MKLTERRLTPDHLPPYTTCLLQQLPATKNLECTGGHPSTWQKCPFPTPASSIPQPAGFVVSSSGNECGETGGIAYDYDTLPKITNIYTAITSDQPCPTAGVHSHSYPAHCATSSHPRDVRAAPSSAYTQSPYVEVEVTHVNDKISLEIKGQRTESYLGTTPVSSALFDPVRGKDEAACCATKACETTNKGSGERYEGQDTKGSFDSTTRTDEPRSTSPEIHLIDGSGEANAAVGDAACVQTNFNGPSSKVEVKPSDEASDNLERLCSLSKEVLPGGSGRWSPLSKKHIVKNIISKIRDLQNKRKQEVCEEKRERLGIVTLALHEKLKALMDQMKQQSEAKEYSEKKGLARVMMQKNENSRGPKLTSNRSRTETDPTSKDEVKFEEKQPSAGKELGKRITEISVANENTGDKQEEPAFSTNKSEESPATNETARKRTWEELGTTPTDTLFKKLCEKIRETQTVSPQLSATGTERQEQIRISPHGPIVVQLGPIEIGSSAGPNQLTGSETSRHAPEQDRRSQLGKPTTNLESENLAKVPGSEKGPSRSVKDFSTQTRKRSGWRIPFPSSRKEALEDEPDRSLSPTSVKRQRLESVMSASTEACTRNSARVQPVGARDSSRDSPHEQSAVTCDSSECKGDVEKSDNRASLSVRNLPIVGSRKVPECEPKTGGSDLSESAGVCIPEQSQRDNNCTQVTTPSVCNNLAQFTGLQGYGLSGSGTADFSYEDDPVRQNRFQLRGRRITNLLGKQGKLLQELNRLRGNDS